MNEEDVEIKKEWTDPRIKKATKLFKYLSDPKRLMIIQILLRDKLIFVEEVQDVLQLSRSAAFDHLKELYEMGIIKKEKRKEDGKPFYVFEKKVFISKNSLRYGKIVVEF